MSLLERFQTKYIPEPNSGCWLWLGALTVGGYGHIFIGNKKTRMAHRVAYELFVKKIPKGLQIDHKCRMRCCVNPDHLEPVTQRENLLRSPIGITAKFARRTHCAQGHLLAERNLISAKNRRRCRICWLKMHQKANRAHYWRKKRKK